MANRFSIQGDVHIDTQTAKADLASLEKTRTKVPIALDAKEARRQADSMLSLIDRMDRKVVRPKVDTAGIKQAKDAVTSLDKAWNRMAAAQKAKMADLSSAFAAGQSMRYGGISGLLSAAPALSGMGTAGLLAAGGGVVAGFAASAGIGQAISSSVARAMQQQKLESFMGRAYKEQAAGFVQASEDMARATGFLAADFMQASLIGKTLVNNYGLQTDQVKKLVEVSADLAATSPYEDIQTVANAMERLQSAVRGEAEASERLGLTLNDTYMKNIAFGGSLRDTWDKMSDLEKAQYRYKEILNQTKDVLGAAEKDEGLSTQVRKLKQVFGELGTELAETALPALAGLVAVVKDIGEAVPDWVPRTIGWVAKTVVPVVGEATVSGMPGLGPIYNIGKGVSAIHSMASSSYIPPNRDQYGNVVIETTVKLVNETSQPMRVQDARSYSPSNY